jgi:hypothetical protein
MFSLMILVIGLYQLAFVPKMMKVKNEIGRFFRTLVRFYLVLSILTSLLFAMSVYYLNVRPDLFLWFDSSEVVLVFLMKFFLIPASIHLYLHYMQVKATMV